MRDDCAADTGLAGARPLGREIVRDALDAELCRSHWIAF
jgi:hypothetical protein